MDVGLPREVKDSEFRVGLVPSGVHALVEDGNRVWVQKGAGDGSGFPDEEYAAAGGKNRRKRRRRLCTERNDR